MRKILYVTFANEEAATGGGQCAGRNLESLQQLVGKDRVVTYILYPQKGSRTFTQRLQRLMGVIKGYMGGLTDEHIRNIMRILSESTFTDVFIDSSQLGILARLIRSRFGDIRICTFFHNIEQDYMRSVTVESGDNAHAFWIRGARINEKDACRYSDSVIVLNAKDSSRLAELYSRKADALIPITMKDNYCDMPDDKLVSCETGTKEAFFLGSYFPGNVKGLKWFCEEVLPEADIHLTIAGSGMDAFADDIQITDKISLFSFVDNLTSLYEKADFVLLPIISGGGMKVKTAESLKYGKYLIATPEAVEGYEVTPDIAAICRTKEDFLREIRNFSRPYKYNKASRDLFTRHHSFDASLDIFRKLLAV